jgi:hypothetical protein
VSFDYPSSPVLNQVYNAPTGQGYIWNGTAWNLAQTSPQAPVASDNPPANPYAGQLWLRSTTGALYMWYVDPNSSQWIQIPGVFMPGGVAGVTDGSNAAAGMVGEYLFANGSSTAIVTGVTFTVNGSQINLTAGDWEVWGWIYFNLTQGASGLNAAISTVAATLPGSNSVAHNFTTASIASTALVVPRIRLSITATTPVYLVGQIGGSGGSPTAQGNTYARRIR